MTLGQKIRALRKSRGMTQSELAGEEITRNMLSRIESGDALPSLSTLLYLAERFSVPAGYFLSESETLLDAKRTRALPGMRKQYALKNYKEVLRLFHRDLNEADDEIAFLVADSATRYAAQLIHAGKLRSACEYIETAKEYMPQTVYDTTHLEAMITLLSSVAQNVQSPRFDLLASDYERKSSDATMEELYAYLTDRNDFPFQNPLYAEHVRAKNLLLSGKYNDALAALTALEEKKSEGGFSILVLFRLYGDLEVCQKDRGDYEAAYRYASKRMSLLNAFRS